MRRNRTHVRVPIDFTLLHAYTDSTLTNSHLRTHASSIPSPCTRTSTIPIRCTAHTHTQVFLESVMLEVRAQDLTAATALARRSLRVHAGAGRLWAVLIQLAGCTEGSTHAASMSSSSSSSPSSSSSASLSTLHATGNRFVSGAGSGTGQPAGSLAVPALFPGDADADAAESDDDEDGPGDDANDDAYDNVVIPTTPEGVFARALEAVPKSGILPSRFSQR